MTILSQRIKVAGEIGSKYPTHDAINFDSIHYPKSVGEALSIIEDSGDVGFIAIEEIGQKDYTEAEMGLFGHLFLGKMYEGKVICRMDPEKTKESPLANLSDHLPYFVAIDPNSETNPIFIYSDEVALLMSKASA
jgi:hypothetical protein